MKRIWRFSGITLLSLICFRLSAQVDSLWHQKPLLIVSGFADVFYVYDFNQPKGTQRQPFLFNHNRHNEVNLNLGFIKLGLDHQKYRVNVALQTGTYVNDNYAAEPGLLKSILEANVGISLNENNNLWLDAGILPSHIGFESVISIDNWTLTRSLLTENSPYFLAGAKLSYRPSDHLEIAGLMLNGWQRIQRVQGNSLPSFSTQVNYTPTNNLKFYCSSFVGTDDPDSTRRMRYFNNLYGQFQITNKLGLIVGFDAGMQQRLKGSSAYDFWFSPVVIGQFDFSRYWKAALRAEYYQDKTGIIIKTSTPNGFRTTGLSLNFDYSPIQNVVYRLEGRLLKSKDDVFETRQSPSTNNFIIGTSIAIKFSDSITH